MSGSNPQWSELERKLAWVLHAQGVGTPEQLREVLGRAQAQGLSHRGSALLGGLVWFQRLTPAQADAVAAQVLGPTAGVSPASPPSDFGPATSSGSGVAQSESGSSGFGASGFGSSGFGSSPGGGASGFGSSDFGSSGFGSSPGGGSSDVGSGAVGSGEVGSGAGGFGSTPGGFGATPGAGASSPGASSAGASRTFELEALRGGGPRFVRRERLGEGVFEGFDRVLERRVELRVGSRGSGVERLARVLGRLDHPAIPKVHDVVEEGEERVLALDPEDGDALGGILGLPATLRPDLQGMARVLLDVASALTHANEVGVVHGEVRPEAIFVGSLGRVRLRGWETARVLPRASRALREAGELAEQAAPKHPYQAPERKLGQAPDEATDVWGLGATLHAALTLEPPKVGAPALAGSTAPAALVAIARKALTPKPQGRYASPRELAEDLARFLDGRSVSAQRPSLVRQAWASARAYPKTAAALCLVSAVGVVGGSWGVREASAQYTAAQALHAQASAAEEAAEARRAEAEAAQGGAERLARVARARRVLVEELAAERISVVTLEEAERQLEVLGEELGDDDPERWRVEVQAWLTAGRYHLSRRRPPDPREALVCFERAVRAQSRRAQLGAVEEGESTAEVWFGVALAARRLPEVRHEIRELEALEALSEAGGALAEWGRLELRLRVLEETALRRVRETPPALANPDPELLAGIEALIEVRPDLAQAHEQRARYMTAVAAPGRHRSEQVRLNGEPASIPRTHYQGFRSYFAAMHLDPVDPVPRAGYMRLLSAKFGIHAVTRWKGGWALGQVVRASELTPRVGPALEAVEQLHRLGRTAGSWHFLRAIRAREGEELRAEAGDPWVRCAVYEVRTLLRAGRRVEGSQLPERAPAELEGDLEMLRGWVALREGRLEDGLNGVFGALQRRGLSPMGFDDMLLALSDPRVSSRELLGVVQAQVPPPSPDDANPVVGALILAQAVLAAREGYDVSPLLPRLQAQGWLNHPASRYNAIAQLAWCEGIAQQDPQQPGPHMQALLTWGGLNTDVDSFERWAVEARDLIVHRLIRLGLGSAAEGFQRLDPVGEIWTVKRWCPPVGYAWELERLP